MYEAVPRGGTKDHAHFHGITAWQAAPPPAAAGPYRMCCASFAGEPPSAITAVTFT